MRSNYSPRKPGTIVKPNAHSSRHTKYLQHTSIRVKVMRWVLCCHSTLHSHAIYLDSVLGQPEVFQSSARSNLDLRLDNIYTCYLFRDSVLNLHSGVYFNKIVSAFTIHQKFHSTSVLVLGCGHKTKAIFQHSLASCLRKIHSRSGFHHFLMPALHGAIPVPEMHNISSSIPQYLHFDVARLVHISFNKYAPVSKSCQCFRRGAVE
mmetsp:Transcript_10026/g.15164  ORF Transcript_10026/g.15164 Transcript_10026/m.15164 type:complete len:206 (-) Transcript_10026:738-1355(-)